MQFPTEVSEVQLDIVGLLAVVGEAAMSGHVQTATASWTALLPRLLPAPQAFLTPSRPYRLPPNSSHVVAVYSGNHSRTLNFFPELMHGIDDLPRHAVHTITLRKRPDHPLRTRGDSVIAVRNFGTMEVLASVGTAFWIALVVTAAVVGDGMALIAMLLLGATSTMIGLGSWWRVDLAQRNSARDVPPGDVVVVGRQGGFLLVRCEEGIARELYFGQEKCSYIVSDDVFRALSAAATLTFMAAVVFLASAVWKIQASIGASYIVLNFAYWIAALLPGSWHWEFGAYEMIEERKVVARSYTACLMEVIKATGGETAWVSKSDAVPKTEAWVNWLEEAGRELGEESRKEEEARRALPEREGKEPMVEGIKWDGERRLTFYLGEAKKVMMEARGDGGEKGDGYGMASRMPVTSPELSA